MAIKIEGGSTVAGNVVGFTAAGEVVAIHRRARQRAWKVIVQHPDHHSFYSGDPRIQTFPTLAGARAHAASLVDEAKTLELAWWPVKVA